MMLVIYIMAVLAVAPMACGQGVVYFVTRAQGIGAKVTFPDGTPVGRGFTAQLFVGPVGTPLNSLTPLLPTTTFEERTSSSTGLPEFTGFVNGKTLVVPGIPEGQKALFFMRAFNGESWETSTCLGQSEPFVTSTGYEGGAPVNLVGLKSFTVDLIPEPTAFGLIAMFCCLGLCWWTIRHRSNPSLSSSGRTCSPVRTLGSAT